MKAMTAEDRYISTDRMRYTKNTKSAVLCYLAVLLDVIYFVSIYRSDVSQWYYQILTGSSIIYNLVFMLVVFLCSEGVKNYRKTFSYVLLVVAVLQVARIFLLPLKAAQAVVVVNSQNVPVMGTSQMILVTACLCLSALCMIAAALINLKKCGMLKKHAREMQELSSGSEEN